MKAPWTAGPPRRGPTGGRARRGPAARRPSAAPARRRELDDLRPRGAQGRAPRPRGAAPREDDRARAPAPSTRASGGVRSRPSTTTRTGPVEPRRCSGRRTVRRGSSARTVPEPTSTASCAARSSCATRRAEGPSPRRARPRPWPAVGDEPVERRGRLERHEGPPLRAPRSRRPGWRPRRLSAATQPTSTRTPGASSRAAPPPVDDGVRIAASRRRRARSCLQDGRGARPRSARVAAGLEVHVERRAAGLARRADARGRSPRRAPRRPAGGTPRPARARRAR